MTRAQRFLTNKEINVLIDLYLYFTIVVGERVQKSQQRSFHILCQAQEKAKDNMGRAGAQDILGKNHFSYSIYYFLVLML